MEIPTGSEQYVFSSELRLKRPNLELNASRMTGQLIPLWDPTNTTKIVRGLSSRLGPGDESRDADQSFPLHESVAV